MPESRASVISTNRLFSIPEFDGKDPQAWLYRANLYFKKNPMDTIEEWDTFEKVKYAQYFMSGPAEIWFIETFTTQPKENWECFCEKMLHHFTNPYGKKNEITTLKGLDDAECEKGSMRRGRLPKVLVLAPTRELAKQVEKEFAGSAPYLSTVCIYGGVSYVTQQNALTRGIDVVVGTPGRIIDLIKNNSLKLGEVQYLVLDEADQMLAVGFEEEVELILENLPSERQSLFFSATMPAWIKKLARKYLNNPLTIDLVGDQDEKLAEGIKLYAMATAGTSKRTILSDLVTVYARSGKAIVFTQTKRGADEVSLGLTNSIASETLHGDISQHQRKRILNGFRQGKFTVLVATDVVARGLDIPNVDLVIHYELPNGPETIVHRSGRTGRAGKQGAAVLMFTSSQKRTVKNLERDVGGKFESITPPSIQEVLESSAEQVVATLGGVHPESIEYFTPTAQKLMDLEGVDALAAALATLSGFAQPPSSRSFIITHQQGLVTLQLIRDAANSRGYLSARSVTGFLSEVYPTAADEIGKIHMIADQEMPGAVFDLPKEIAKELLTREIPPGNTLGDGFILGMVVALWKDDESDHISPIVWDGNTNKYKEDQKVSWHATSFEEGLEKALSEGIFESHRNRKSGTLLAKFLKACETIPETPVKIRKGSEKWEVWDLELVTSYFRIWDPGGGISCAKIC